MQMSFLFLTQSSDLHVSDSLLPSKRIAVHCRKQWVRACVWVCVFRLQVYEAFATMAPR